VKRAVRRYFGGLFSSVALFALAARLSPEAAADAHELLRFCLFGAGTAAAVGCWHAAVQLAAVHGAMWPLGLSTGGVASATVLWILTR
jgi:hypothetical protein